MGTPGPAHRGAAGRQLDLIADGLDGQWETMAHSSMRRASSAAAARWLRSRAPRRRRVKWLQQRIGLGDLLDYDFGRLDLTRRYRVSDRLLAHRAILEAHLYHQERDLFSLAETITLYDLPNTFFEGTASCNPKAKHGHSKEKHSDCPLVTLALVLEPAGFPSAARSSRAMPASHAGQELVTVVLHRDDGQIYHIRKATRPEPYQQVLDNALGLPHLPGKTEKTLIDPRAEVSQM